MVPDVIMSQSIQLHHECIRRCAVANNGYESAWEGDSVILAFHRAQDAALFCINVQERLMRLPWPEELLEASACHTDVCAIRLRPGSTTGCHIPYGCLLDLPYPLVTQTSA